MSATIHSCWDRDVGYRVCVRARAYTLLCPPLLAAVILHFLIILQVSSGQAQLTWLHEREQSTFTGRGAQGTSLHG